MPFFGGNNNGDSNNKGNNNGNKTKSGAVLEQIEEVKDKMHDNVATMLDNVEKAENVRDKSETLKQNAGIFKKRTTQLKRAMWWKNVKLMIIIGVIVIIIAGVIVAVILL